MQEGDGFSAKTLGKSRFHLLTDLSGNGPAASSDKWKALYDLPEIAKISTGKRRENIKKEKNTASQRRDVWHLFMIQRSLNY